MADENTVDLGSIFEFASEISTQEAPPPLPPRGYVGEITGATAKQSNRGNTYIDVEFSIQPDQFPADFTGSREVAKLHYRRLVVMPDTDRNRYQVRKFCEAIRAIPTGRRVDINDWIGKVANLKVKSTKYMGEERAEIDAVELA